MATPVLTAGRMGGVDPAHISLLMGRLIAPLALVVPFLLLLMLDGRRGVRQLLAASTGYRCYFRTRASFYAAAVF